MSFSVLTYNLLYNKALDKTKFFLPQLSPEIVCFQELETKEASFKKIEQLGYRLGDFSNSFIKFGKIYGIATFYNPRSFILNSSNILNLPRSIYEFFLSLFRTKNVPRTVLKTTFIHKGTKKLLTVYNLHLTSWGTDGARAKQIRKILQGFDKEINKNPFIVMGDFNYPYGRKRFEKLIEKGNLKEATKNLFYTFERKVFRFIPIRLKTDYILYRNLELVGNKRIEKKYSDHFPIMAEFRLKG